MMVMYPLPDKEYDRNQLCVNELYHRLQNKLKLNFSGYNNDYLDNKNARILIKLEWLALENTIKENNKKRTECLKNASIFRNYRRELYSGKDSIENKIEIHEGLAEYTGPKLCSKNNEDFKNQTLKAKDKYWNKETYVRSFAYYLSLWLRIEIK